MDTRYNPFTELERMFDRMSRQFEEAAEGWDGEGAMERWSRSREMPMDIIEEDESFVVTVEVPGFEREDVEVSVTNRTLIVEAHRDETVETTDERFLRRERRHRSTSRTIELPEEVDEADVTATMKNGILTIELPKLEVAERQSVEISVA